MLITVTVVAATRISTGVWAWVMPMPRWCGSRRVTENGANGVVADAEVCGGLVGGLGFGAGVVGLLGGGVAGVGAVCSLGVVEGAEGVEQGL